MGLFAARRARWGKLLPQRNTCVDGDTASLNALYTDESLKEIRDFLNTKNAYVNPRGGLRASADVHTVALVLKNMTG